MTLEVTVFDESTHTAAEAAAAVGAELGQIVKSLVFVAPGDDGLEPIICLVSGPNRVDLARLAAVTGEADIRRATAREANELTGFVIGGIPPIGHIRPVRVDHGPGPRALPGRLGGGRAADRGLPGAAGDPPDPRQRHGRPDRRGAARDRGAGEPGAERDRSADRGPTRRVTAEPRNATVAYPGGLRARWRWGGSGQGAAVFALSEVGGRVIDLGERVAADPEPLCRAELRLEGPRGAWTARFASLIPDEPRAILWDTAGLLVVELRVPHLRARDRRPATPRWEHRSATPIVALLGSSRLAHVLVQAELETFAIEPDGTVAWRVAHSDVVTAAELVGGRLVLTGFDGQLNALDPDRRGRSAGLRPSSDAADPAACGQAVDNSMGRPRCCGQVPLHRCAPAPYR